MSVSIRAAGVRKAYRDGERLVQVITNSIDQVFEVDRHLFDSLMLIKVGIVIKRTSKPIGEEINDETQVHCVEDQCKFDTSEFEQLPKDTCWS